MQFTVLLLCTLCALLAESIAQETESENGYIFTSPRSLNTGTVNELHLRRFGKLDSGTLKVQVYYTDYSSSNETLAVENDFEIPSGEKDSFLKLQVDKFDNYVYNGRINISGSFGDYKISGSDSVYFSTPKTKIVIIQTDKPVYKPGQTVKFRVLKVDKNLKPSGKDDDKADIYVEDPKGTRLFQFKGVPLGNGIVQNEFPLSDEPLQGNWKISASINNEKESVNFEVKEYVLPKFDVTIKFPTFVLADAETIPIEICAKYTYGKPVIGTLNLNSSVEKYSYSREKYPTLQESIKIEGCYNYTLNVSLIETGNTYRYRRIQIVANVVEEGTGVDRNETQYLQRQYSPLNLAFNNDQSFYKPGLPFNGKLQVSNPDDSPAANEPIEICATVTKERVLAEWWATKKLKFCKNYTSDSMGVIQYTVLSQNIDVVSINLEAKSIKYAKVPKQSGEKKSILNEPQTSLSLNPYYSPSGSFIQLQDIDQPVPCGQKQSFKLLFTSKENANLKFYYQVTKQTGVVLSGNVEKSFSVEDNAASKYENDDRVLRGEEIQLVPPPQSIKQPSNADEDCPSSKEAKYLPPVGEVSFDVDVDANLSPSFHILIYYVRDDQEVVADSQKIEVEKCFKNKVNFAFGDEAQQPGLKTSIQITAAPNSLCGIKTVDKSISLLNNNDQLTKENVFQMIQNMDNNQYYTSNPCHQAVRQPGLYSTPSKIIIRPPPRPVGSYSYDDSLSAFQSSGFIVISDLMLVTRPCSNNDGGYGVGSSGGAYQTEALAFDSAAPPPGMSAARRPAASPLAAEAKIGISATKSVKDVRTFFPETWLFDMEMTGPDGTYVSKERLPDTITQWIGSAACINSEEGLGISSTTSITAFQAFFLDYTLPVSVIRGEEFVVVVSIFSYAEGALPVTVSLDAPEGFEIMGESINGDVCIQPDSTESLRVKLKATTVGKINITVRAETAESSTICGTSTVSESVAKDAITKSLVVEAEGFPQEKVFNSLFCPSDDGKDSYENTVELNLPEDIVPDSSRAYIDFTGNVLGKAIDNLDRLVALPTGCGEQNMVKFTPNYLVLDYLNDIGMLTDAITKKAKKNLNTGYQRELTYRHNDGSFSAFGKVDKEGSMFLTAFVLRSFYEAKKYITIDENILTRMQQWIASKQREDGCFPDVGKIIDIGLQGGIEKEKSSGSITAYVLASLLISKFENETVTNAAFSCLILNPPSTPYGSFLYAYAEALAGKTDEAKARIENVREKVHKKDGMEYFIIVNGSQSIQIETDAYAVLTTLKTGGSANDVLAYIRYLTANLNPRGGFKSTQDTCVGLNALAQFAKLVYKDPLNLKISTASGLEQSVELTDDNKLLVQRFKVSKVPGDIKIEATGTGCGLIQTSLRYNTKTPPEKMKFFLDLNGKCSGTDCKLATINVFVSYLPPGQKAGMSLVEIKLITGTVAVKESLDKLKANESNQILRYDIENNMVIFYFSEISNEGQVFDFKVEKIVEVENSQPGTAKVYDYYANENSATTSYTIKGINSDSGPVESEDV